MLVQITPKGRQKYEEAAAHSDQTLETYFKALTASEREHAPYSPDEAAGKGATLS